MQGSGLGSSLLPLSSLACGIRASGPHEPSNWLHVPGSGSLAPPPSSPKCRDWGSEAMHHFCPALPARIELHAALHAQGHSPQSTFQTLGEPDMACWPEVQHPWSNILVLEPESNFVWAIAVNVRYAAPLFLPQFCRVASVLYHVAPIPCFFRLSYIRLVDDKLLLCPPCPGRITIHPDKPLSIAILQLTLVPFSLLSWDCK